MQVWYDAKGYHSLPVYLNAHNNAILRANLPAHKGNPAAYGMCRTQGGYIFYAGASLAGAGYCRQCRRRPAILPLQLRQGCQVCVKISAQ